VPRVHSRLARLTRRAAAPAAARALRVVLGAATLIGVGAAAVVLAAPASVRAAAWSEGIPLGAPTSVGMSAERLAAVDRVVLRGIGAGGFPGASVVVGRRGYAVIKRGYGRLSWSDESAPVDAQSIYDLASLTKVVGLTSAVMALYDDGKLDLDAPVRNYLPAFSGGAKDRVTVRHLLTHRSGLPAGRDLWRIAGSPSEARRAVVATPLYCQPGACFEYSDLGADVLGFVVEAVSGRQLDVFLQERIFGPLGMTDTYFRPPAQLRGRIAPTEVTPPRGYPLRGEVHDENAYALGGVAGHAGLFSTAADLSIYAQMMLNGGSYNGVRVLADSTVRLFTRRAAGTRALGWDTCNAGGSGSGSCGVMMGEAAYGHTGFTGTSLWIDPERDMFVVLLANRVHAARARRPAKVIADVRADLADAAEAAVLDDPYGPRAMPTAFRADAAAGWNAVERASRGRSSERAVRGAKGKAAKSAKAGRSGKSGKARGAKSASAGRSAKTSRSAKAGSAQATGAKSAKGKSAKSTKGRR
jgi:CubicO group peptidase (beta-lactamase class C family)